MADNDAEKKKETAVKKKKPSALKRDEQAEKTRLRNRSFRASVTTAIRSFEASLAEKQSEKMVREKLNEIYSLVDQGVKKGVFKVGKAARTKSRLTLRAV